MSTHCSVNIVLTRVSSLKLIIVNMLTLGGWKLLNCLTLIHCKRRYRTCLDE